MGAEVIVGLCDELAHFIDEQANPRSSQHGGQRVDPAIGEGQHQAAGEEEQETSPEDMSDVEFIGRNLRIPRHFQEEPGHDNADGKT
jgi:hypothetical protein